MLAVALVAGQQFVAAVTAEHHLDLAAGRLRQVPQRDRRRVGKGIVEGRDNRRKVVANAARHRHHMVLQAEPPAQAGGLRGLVERGFRESGGEGGKAMAEGRQPGRDHARIDAAGEKQADRPVGDAAPLDGLIERRLPVAGR